MVAVAHNKSTCETSDKVDMHVKSMSDDARGSEDPTAVRAEWRPWRPHTSKLVGICKLLTRDCGFLDATREVNLNFNV